MRTNLARIIVGDMPMALHQETCLDAPMDDLLLAYKSRRICRALWMTRTTHRTELAGHTELPHQSQDVVGEMQDQIVGGELTGGQALQVEIGLNLAVELLVSGMRQIFLGGAVHLTR